MSTAPISVSSRPRGFQFGLLTLLLAMTSIGLVCVALRSPNELSSDALSVVFSASLLVAALMIVYRSGRTRAFAVGFLTFGAAYGFLSLGESQRSNYSRSALPTTRWAVALYSRMHGDGMLSVTAQVATAVFTAPQPGPMIPVPATGVLDVEYPVPRPVVTGSSPVPPPVLALAPPAYRVVTRAVPLASASLPAFLEVSHRSFGMLLAILGGILAQFLYATRRDSNVGP